ncbi:Twinfilin-1 [Tilletia horrida]|nr:Twinfilin-1 [Tilletia horrida]
MPPASVRVSDGLVELFQATTASTEPQPHPRAILVQAEENNTLLTNTKTFAPAQTDNQDFAPALRELLADEPSRSGYILFRLDTTAAAGTWEWIICCYQPPTAPIREKMRYSQTKAALVQALHELNFLDVIYGQSPGEFSFPTKLRNARKIDYQNPNVGLQGRSAAQAAGAGTGGVRRNFGQIGKATQAPTAMPTSAPVPASAARPSRPFAGAAPTPFSSATPATASAAAAPAAADAPQQQTIQDVEEKEEPKETAPAAATEVQDVSSSSTSSGIPLPQTAAQAAELAENDDDDDDWDGPAAMQDSRVPSPVQVGHVAEAPKLDTVDEELAAAARAQTEAAAAAQQDAGGVQPDALEKALEVAEREKDADAEQEAPPLAPVDDAQEKPSVQSETVEPPVEVERPSEPVAAILEDSVPVDQGVLPDAAAAPTVLDDAPLDTSNGIIASTEKPAAVPELAVPSTLGVAAAAAAPVPKTPGSDSASLIVEPPTPAPVRADPEEDSLPVTSPTVQVAAKEDVAPEAVPVSPATVPAAPPPTATLPSTKLAPSPASGPAAAAAAAPISVSGYGTKAGDSLLTDEEATKAEVDRAVAAERASYAPPPKSGLGPAHTVHSFEWEEEVLPALSTLPIRASGASEFNFVLLSLNLTPGEERVELRAPPRFLPAAEVGQALAAEDGPRYALYRLEGTPVFADDEEAGKPGGSGRRSSSSPIATTGGGLLFIYSCPLTSSVRERMLYSTNLRSFVYLAEQRVAGLRVQKRVETSDPAELTASFLAAELSRVNIDAQRDPNAATNEASAGAATSAADGAGIGAGNLLGASTQAFSRPKRPGGKR